MNKQPFNYYRSGVCEAQILFNEENIKHKEKDIYNNTWNDFEILTPKSNKNYEMNLLDLHLILKNSLKVNWNSPYIQLLGQTYHRYMDLENTIKGEKLTATIFVLRNQSKPIDLIVYNQQIIGFIYLNTSILVKDGFEPLTPLTLWNDSTLSKADYSVNHLETEMVTMRDGIKLATEIWLPKPLNGTVPTILVRTPYGRMNQELQLRFVKRGYALVVQDVRGREDSEGDWLPYYYEINDGDDTINWIVEQPFSNGKVGTIGGSYLGATQWAAAASGNPHLKAIISQVTAGSAFVDITRKGGMIASGSLAWAFMMSEKRMNRNAMSRPDWEDILNVRPLVDIPQKALGKALPFWNEQLSHMTNDAFWKKKDWSLHGEKINVPSLLISGWYDDNGMGTTEAWEMNNQNERENIKLIYGPWYHGFNTTRDIHNIPFGDNAIRYDLEVLYVKWFDHFLKDIDNKINEEPAVDYYLVGSNEWKKASTWPPKESQLVNYYFGSNTDAKTSFGDGALTTQLRSTTPSDTFIFDPLNPAPHLIELSENELSVPENYRDVERRDDVLVYTSETLQENLTIAGDIFCELYASTDSRDTDWVVRLLDVDEDGNSIRLTDGFFRARFRESFEKENLLEPNKIYKYTIRIAKMANVFKKGHKIRVQVTSGAKNLYFPNHNTGNNPATDTEYIMATQTIYHEEKYPSHIKLPIIKD